MPRAKKATSGKRRTTVTRSADKPPSIRGEKRVKKTDTSVPVAPARRARGRHDGPTDPAAIDRRRQVIGTDEPGGHRSRTDRSS